MLIALRVEHCFLRLAREIFRSVRFGPGLPLVPSGGNIEPGVNAGFVPRATPSQPAPNPHHHATPELLLHARFRSLVCARPTNMALRYPHSSRSSKHELRARR